MIKIMSTGDLHLGKNYSSHHEEARRKYSEARFSALRNLVKAANERECDYIIITGDMFDKKSVSVGDISAACSILGTFDGTVAVIPGNHDYYEDKKDGLWNRFNEKRCDNTLLLTENQPYPMDKLILYPAICHSKHSSENAIGWIKEDTSVHDVNMIHIGVAHGSIEGVSPDPDHEYFPMSIQELTNSNVDLWLIGHTHVPYPAEPFIKNPKILNAGTHQQTDIADNSEGSAFFVVIDDDRQITAERVHTGEIRFISIAVDVAHGCSLEDSVSDALSEYLNDAENISVRISITGTALKSDYDIREKIYEKYSSRFILFEVFDNDLKAEITAEMIDNETNKGSIENELLKKYIDEPDILNLAFDLIKKCKEA